MNRRYEVLDVLGSGGMATVWRARDTELNRIVAIKRPHPAPEGSAVHERFRREARAAATVSHPSLVTVHDVGTDDDGPYLVMEFVDAGSLAEIEWSRAKAIGIGTDIAEALAALHAAGIVHRDVKPANILVPEGGAMLTDFGIARSGDDAALTQEGTTFATPAYAAPEVIARGDHTPASDIYALAAVLREMILGRRVTPTTDTQVLIADDLWGPVLNRAMSARPDERPSASTFADELRLLPAAAGLPPTTALRLERDVPSIARAESPPPPKDQPVVDADPASRDRPWLPAVAVALAAFMLVAVLVVAVRRSTGDDDVAENPPSSAVATENISAPTETGEPTSEPAATAQAEPAETVPPTNAQPTTVPEQQVDLVRTDLVAFVSNIPDDVLKSKEADKLIDDIDKAIEAAENGDIDRATREIEDALGRIDKQIDDVATADSATELVLRIAGQLGLQID